uniref:Uncharacterized protein n=1 Tax=Arundo donax TaxID=35708 RepID=A0A0A9DAE3_ARUDO
MSGSTRQACVSGLQTTVRNPVPSKPEKQTSPPEEPTSQRSQAGRNQKGSLYRACRGRLRTLHCGGEWAPPPLEKVRRQGPWEGTAACAARNAGS